MNTTTRKTKETDIEVQMDIYGSGKTNISTGIGFFDHMLSALALHASWDLDLSVNGDLNVDGHHTVEDVGIVLGQTFHNFISIKEGLKRYGYFSVPMDEALATANVDLSGRPYLVFSSEFRADKIGDLDTQLIIEFFRAFAMNAQITLHLMLEYGENDHHKAEALFKAFAHSIRIATEKTGDRLLSTKGTL